MVMPLDRHRSPVPAGPEPGLPDRRHGVNIQLLVDLHRFREARWAQMVHHSGGGMADLGYEGEPTVHAPLKKKPGTPLAGWQAQLNRAVSH